MNKLETENPSILCISPYFVPFVGPEPFCGAKMVKALMDLGIDTRVIFIDKRYLQPFHPHLKYGDDSSRIWESLTDIAVGVGKPRTPRNLFFLLLAAIRYRTKSYTHWIGGIVKQAKALHRDHSFDIVYSRSPHMLAHAAGYWCAKALNAVWIANINDPWDVHFYPDRQRSVTPAHRLVSKYWLKKTLRSADLVTYPSKRLYDFHAKLAKINHNAAIIPHVGYHSNKKSQFDGFNLIHAGRLGINLFSRRSSKGLLSGVAQFLQAHPQARKMTRLTLVGPEDEEIQSITEQLRLKEIVSSVGLVSYEQSLEYIKSASVCILVERTMNEGIFLPSKFVDYIAARKPVLALSPSVGVIADMIPTQGLVRVDADDHDAVAKALGDFYRHFKDGSLDAVAPTDEFVNQFEPQTVAQKFLDAVNKIRR